MAEVPASLKSIKKYLEQGKTVDNPVVAYHCRLWALQQAMNMRSKLPKEDMGFIMTLMDEVEKEKGGLDLDDASMQCENYAQDLFTKADDADRNGQSTLPTAKVFLAAAQIYEVCEQFGELPTDVVEKNKYAKWRFVEICKAAKERRAPAPPRGVAPAADEPEDPPPPPPPEAPKGGGSSDAPDYLSGLPPPPPDLIPSVPSKNPSFTAPTVPSGDPLANAADGLQRTPTVPSFVLNAQNINPSRIQMMEALKLCQGAVSCLQFQQPQEAVQQLTQALKCLTTPPQP
jgi:vacuolar protein sorting-associated protein VTA1